MAEIKVSPKMKAEAAFIRVWDSREQKWHYMGPYHGENVFKRQLTKYRIWRWNRRRRK